MIQDTVRNTYIAADKAVHLNLLDERGVVGHGVSGGHEALVGFLVPVLRYKEEGRKKKNKNKMKENRVRLDIS